MPYAPSRRGPVAVAVSVIVAILAAVLGVASIGSHHASRGVVLLVGAVVALIVAFLASRQEG